MAENKADVRVMLWPIGRAPMPRSYASDFGGSESIARNQKRLGRDDGRLHQAAAGAQDPEGRPADAQPHIARARRVDEAPTIDLSGAHGQLGLGPSCEKAGLAFLPVPLFRPAARRDDRSIAIQHGVVAHQHAFTVDREFVGPAQNQRAIQTALHSHSLVAVRVVPECAGIGE